MENAHLKRLLLIKECSGLEELLLIEDKLDQAEEQLQF
jgi:hypothetical protein